MTEEEWGASTTRAADGRDIIVTVTAESGNRWFTVSGHQDGSVVVLNLVPARWVGAGRTGDGAGDAIGFGCIAVRRYGPGEGNAVNLGGVREGNYPEASVDEDARGKAWSDPQHPSSKAATTAEGEESIDHRGAARRLTREERTPVRGLPAIPHAVTLGHGWMRVGCQFATLADWAKDAEAIDRKHGNELGPRPGTLARRMALLFRPGDPLGPEVIAPPAPVFDRDAVAKALRALSDGTTDLAGALGIDIDTRL